jgi:hypothetical protein
VVVAVGAGTAAYLLFFHKSSAEALSPDQVVSGFAQSYTALAHSMSATDLTRAKVYLCDKDQVALQGIYDRERSSGGRRRGLVVLPHHVRPGQHQRERRHVHPGDQGQGRLSTAPAGEPGQAERQVAGVRHTVRTVTPSRRDTP